MAKWIQSGGGCPRLPSCEETDAAKYIGETPGGDFTEVLKNDRRFGVFFHLSPMRESILNWYPFEEDAAILELGGGMGALTGMLCARSACTVSLEPDAFKAHALFKRHFTRGNLTVICEDVYGGGEQFDYIVLLDPPETSAEYFGKIAGFLKPHGRLLLALENRFGLRYWCGKRDGTGMPFNGIMNKSTDKAQLSRNLERAGFAGQKWYYPMSDHWFAQDIYSQDCLPDSFSTARFSPYVEPEPTLIMNEQLLYKDIIQNRVFDFFSNAYLIEARTCAEDAPCPVDYAAVTTYRTPEKRFATLISGGDGRARKIPLHPDGQRSVWNMLDNHRALSERGINTVPLSLEGNSIVMPRISHETLIDYWQRTLSDGSFDFGKFARMFDRMYDIIMQSSETYPPGAFGWDPVLGSVQKTAYPELVPANCFYDVYNDTLIFFDQEFMRPNCPVKFVLTRLVMSIKYSTLYRNNRIAAFFEELKRRFALDICWERLAEEERAFLKSVFNFDCTAPIEALRRPNKNLAEGNILKLLDYSNKKTITKDIPEYLKNAGVRRAVIYGLGTRGRRLYNMLVPYGISVPFAIDRNANELASDLGLPVYARLEDAPRGGDSIDMIIVSPSGGTDEVLKNLRGRTGCPVITLDEIFADIDKRLLL